MQSQNVTVFDHFDGRANRDMLVELLNEALRLLQEEEVDGGPGVDGGEPTKVEIAAEVNTRNINCKIQERKYGGENWKPYRRLQLRPIESGSSL
nr:hypothetical protein Iba_chr14aCG27000 [Ipomoea batatas]